jgi:ADP-L-glycero-D-manno-heptose 6-epimerase
MIIVTGGAGFVGSNLIRRLNSSGYSDIYVVDNFINGKSYSNLLDCKYLEIFNSDEFLINLINNKFKKKIDAIFHQGAITDTMCWDGDIMMKNNYYFSKKLLDYCEEANIRIIYASSASVYGQSTNFDDNSVNYKPLNLYAFSKLEIDKYFLNKLNNNSNFSAVGLRYFNVYGPYENEKKNMASVIFQFYNQGLESKKIKLFGKSHEYSNGDQIRDFIYIDDVIDVNLWFFENPNLKGIYNCGSGYMRTFNDVANIIKNSLDKNIKLEYIDFPLHLYESYQPFTLSNNDKLSKTGFSKNFTTLEQGINNYINWINS